MSRRYLLEMAEPGCAPNEPGAHRLAPTSGRPSFPPQTLSTSLAVSIIRLGIYLLITSEHLCAVTRTGVCEFEQQSRSGIMNLNGLNAAAFQLRTVSSTHNRLLTPQYYARLSLSTFGMIIFALRERKGRVPGLTLSWALCRRSVGPQP